MEELIDLIQRYKSADSPDEKERWAAALFERAGPTLRAYIAGQLGYNREATKDLFQETLWALFKALGSYEFVSDKQFWAFAYTIAHRRVIDFLRRPNGRLVPMDPDEFAAVLDLHAQTPPKDASLQEHCFYVLAQLSEECFILLFLRFVEDVEVEGIARILGLTTGATGLRIKRCLKKARGKFGEG